MWTVRNPHPKVVILPLWDSGGATLSWLHLNRRHPGLTRRLECWGPREKERLREGVGAGWGGWVPNLYSKASLGNLDRTESQQPALGPVCQWEKWSHRRGIQDEHPGQGLDGRIRSQRELKGGQVNQEVRVGPETRGKKRIILAATEAYSQNHWTNQYTNKSQDKAIGAPPPKS